MKHLFFLFLLLSTFQCTTANNPKGPIKGNGSLTSEARSLADFDAIFLNFGVQLVIDASQDAPVKVQIDENLQDNLITRINGTTLYIDQQGWIEPTAEVKITLGNTQLKQVTSSSHGDIFISDFTGANLTLAAEVGNISINGQTKLLTVANDNGEIDASELKAASINVKNTGWGDTKVNTNGPLQVEAPGSGTVIYAGQPSSITSNLSPEAEIYPITEAAAKATAYAEVEWLDIRIVNNSKKRIQTVVKGPRGNRFGYGMPIKAGQVKKEKWPIGTKLFQTSPLGRKLIYEVKAGDDQKKQLLF